MTNAQYNPGAAELGRKNQPGGYVGFGGGPYPFSATTLTLAPGVSSQPTVNGQVTLDIPNNERLRHSVKGSDGQVRWFTAPRYNHATNSLAIGDIGASVFKDGLQFHAAWNTVIIGQLAASGVAPLDTDIFSDTVIVGAYAANDAYHGNGAVVVGNRALQDLQQIDHMTCLGDSTYRFATSGTDGVAVGYVAGQEVLSVDRGITVGSYSSAYVTAMRDGITIGYYAGARDPNQKRPLGDYVIAVGTTALRYADGSYIIGIGKDAFYSTSGGFNVGVGVRVGDGITTGTNNTFLGSYAGTSSGGIQKVDAIESIGIGYFVRTTKDYQAILGSSNITETILRGKVQWNPPATANPDSNGQVCLEFTDNETITLKGRGTDGTVRVLAFTIAEEEAPDPYGSEMLLNTAATGYVTGTPGTKPTNWFDLQTTGALADPNLTFVVAASRRVIYQTFAVTAGTFKLETTATLNSGTALLEEALNYAMPAGTTVEWFLDDVASTRSASLTGTKKITIIATVTNSGTLEFRLGAGIVGNRTQSITHTAPTLKKAI